MRDAIIGCVMALSLAACASTPEAPAGPPSLEVSANVPAPARARFYADCLSQSAAEQTYFREQRHDEFLRFNCEGEPARRFFDGLAAYSAEVGSEMTVGAQTWRFTAPIQRDTVGLDYCIRDRRTNGDEVFNCTVVLNAGRYLRD